MTTTEQYIGTGSLMTQGLKPGLAYSMSTISGTFGQIAPRLIFVNYDPSGVMPCVTGSDICYVVGTGSFMIGDIVNGAGGVGWHALRTV